MTGRVIVSEIFKREPGLGEGGVGESHRIAEPEGVNTRGAEGEPKGGRDDGGGEEHKCVGHSSASGDGDGEGAEPKDAMMSGGGGDGEGQTRGTTAESQGANATSSAADWF